MTERADVVVVGGRCGGAATAMLLARAGRRVVLLERGRPSKDVVSTLYIQPPGMEHLRRWGLLPDVEALGAPELADTTCTIGDVTVRGCARWPAGTPHARAPRRHDLDPLLASAAADAGADVRTRAAVTRVELHPSGPGATVTYTSSRPGMARATHTIETALVVGADGMRSTVAESVGAGYERQDPTLSCAYYTYWYGLDASFATIENDAGWVSSVPTSNGAVLVSAYFPQSAFNSVRHRAFEAYLECIRAVAPELYAQIEGAERAGPIVGYGDQRNFIRQGSGKGWALVGDAGIHKDSLTARGIGEAFVQAGLLAHHLDGVEGPATTDALLRYAADRNVMLTDSYLATLVVADPDNRPRREAVLRAIADDRELIQRYFDTVAGLAPPSRLYTPELTARLNDVPALAEQIHS